jgi:hypothetical protein
LHDKEIQLTCGLWLSECCWCFYIEIVGCVCPKCGGVDVNSYQMFTTTHHHKPRAP